MTVSEPAVIAEITDRLQLIFQRYQAGKDVAPVALYRCEGMIEAAMMAGHLDEQSARQLVRGIYQQYFEQPFPPSLKASQLPTMMRRAPVKPSTSD